MGVTDCTCSPRSLLIPGKMNIKILTLTLVALVSASPLSRVRRQTANEVALRRVAISKSKPELLSIAVSHADPDLLRVALTDANPDLLEVALTKAKAELLGTALSDADVRLLGTALTQGVERELLVTALTRS